ncbi:flavin monoamine oxidase family protein [Mycobacterium aquaticum]|uniref:flavin monoamine oxidase family protein n=1 Tax=Mycobacterium aquaticum TaxID=1927124 RepID=UPI001301FA4F|nr:FAD-dependent oxidoreductase [Mycobacterium aquaticum]
MVVGAGLSGLTAAYLLRDRDVVVLEADSQIGGRSQRTELGGWPTTTGGEGWYDPNPESPESRLLSELGIKTVPVPGTPLLHTSDGCSVELSTAEQLADDLGFSPEARPDFLRTFARVAETLDALSCPQTDELIGKLVSVTGIEWIGPVHDEVLAYYRRIAAVEMGVSLESDSAFSLLTGMPAFGGASEVWGDFLAVEGGAPVIGLAMAEQLPRPPVTGALVTAVEQKGQRVTVTYRHNGQDKTLDADHVVVATPHPITAQIVRRLSPTKAAAMDSVRVLPIVEVVLLLADGGPVPWDGFSAIWTIDKSFSVGLNSKTHQIVGAVGEQKHSVIKMIAVGPSAAPLADRTDDCIAEIFTNDFISIYPEARDKVREHSIRRWTHGIPAVAFGFDQHVGEMVNPVGNIHFAGDWCGFVDAANPAGAGVNGDWGGYGICGGLHPGVRAGLRVAAEIRGNNL